MASVALERPDRFRIGRVLSDSFAVIGRNPSLCLWLILIFYGLPRVVFALLSWAIIRNPGVAELSVYRVIYETVKTTSYLCFDGILQAALAYMAIEDLRGSRRSLRDCIRTTSTRLLPAIVIFLIVNEPYRIISGVIGRSIDVPTSIPYPLNVGIYGICLVLAYIPGMVLLVSWFIALPVLMRERSGVLRSLARSRDLTKGSRRLLLGLWFIFLVAEIGIGFAEAGIFRSGTTPRFFLDAVITAADSLVMAIVLAASYVELRRVKEGASVDELAEIFA